MKENSTLKEDALKKSEESYQTKPSVPFGHILSLLTEEMRIEKPNLKRIFLLFNNQMNGSGKIKDLNEIIYCGSGKYQGIIQYLNILEKEGANDILSTLKCGVSEVKSKQI
jgi:hypothetical protein